MRRIHVAPPPKKQEFNISSTFLEAYIFKNHKVVQKGWGGEMTLKQTNKPAFPKKTKSIYNRSRILNYH